MEQLLQYIKEYEEVKWLKKLPRTLTHSKSYLYIFWVDAKFAWPYLWSKDYWFVWWMIKNHPWEFNQRKKIFYVRTLRPYETWVEESYDEYDDVSCAYMYIAGSYDPIWQIRFLFGLM